MTLRKTTIDNSVKYIPSTNTSPSENPHDCKAKTVSNPRKQNENFSQNSKKFAKNYIAGEGLRKIK